MVQRGHAVRVTPIDIKTWVVFPEDEERYYLITVLESKDERILGTTAEWVYLQLIVGEKTVSECLALHRSAL